LIFHAYDIPLYRAPMPDRAETKPNSVWILWSDEPPSIINYTPFNSYHFNWTISYKLNSEISIATYGLFSKRNNPLSNDEYQYWIEKEFSNRINGALWFVSNCNAKKRLELFYNLKYASKLLIEGYGHCIDYYPIHWCGSYTRCEYDYMSNFKFYLSFESNTCRDYITEKFYKAFYHGLIPIVYGPEKIDYNRLAPKNSFIHIEDFDKDMNKLANYIEEIHSNLTLFSLFHQWRKDYEIIIDGKALERIRMCELCQRLVNIRQGEMIYYKTIDQFYNDKCDYI
jgi:glycoprotein 3-alpha-L-fucosyltransferase